MRNDLTLDCYANGSSTISRVQHTYMITVANASETFNTHMSSEAPITVFDVLRNFELNCSIANENSEFQIQWFRDDHEITSDAAYFRDGKAQLHIFNATDRNEGIYKCAVVLKDADFGKIDLYQTFKFAFKPYWSKWSPWNRCQPKCGKDSTRRRVRICHRSKLLQPYKKWRCSGANVQRERCKVAACGREGAWTEWSVWSGCSRTCGYGQMFRYRECSDGDGQCDGPTVEVIQCFRMHCAENTRETSNKNSFLPYKMYSRSLALT